VIDYGIVNKNSEQNKAFYLIETEENVAFIDVHIFSILAHFIRNIF
jgi:hypothetical protein